MRMINLAAVAALAILAASPAFAGDRRGGGGHPGGGGSCGGGCGGGGHQPPPQTPPPPRGGGYNSNINVNVNANANANASANAWAGAGAGGYFNARAYDVGGIRRGGGSYGAVYVGGGGGDVGGYYGGGAIYTEEVYEGRTCASAPFGYVVTGFGRNGRRAPACVATSVCRDAGDRGGRYGYSEHRGCDGGRREERHDRYEASSTWESYESREEYSAYSGGYSDERAYSDGGRGCGVCRPNHRERDYGHEPYRPPVPAPPVYEAPAYEAPAYQPPVYDVPMTPNQYYGIGDQSPPPRQHYSQEPGERG